jgi:hypothetical protein
VVSSTLSERGFLMKYTFTNEKNTFRVTVEGTSQKDCFAKFAKQHNLGTFAETMMVKKEDNAFKIYLLAANAGELLLCENMSPKKVKVEVKKSTISVPEQYDIAAYDWQLNESFLQYMFETKTYVRFLFPEYSYLYIEIPIDVINEKIKEGNFILDYGYNVEVNND